MAEPDRDNSDDLDTTDTIQKTELRFTLKKGAAAGNLLHDALEVVDFQQPNWSQALHKPLIRFGELDQYHAFAGSGQVIDVINRTDHGSTIF